ncbi:hypothetical protein DDK19_04155 [Pseudomonas aeruginosa]|nr:hypothetical protein DDK19_04155 [Pseudomonas aeruginosa]
MSPLLTIEELAQFLQKSVTSIRSDVSRNPQSLPPICRLPGTRRLLWRVEDVERWLAEHVESAQSSARVVPGPLRNTKLGRPTKAEQLERKRLQHEPTSVSRGVSNGN